MGYRIESQEASSRSFSPHLKKLHVRLASTRDLRPVRENAEYAAALKARRDETGQATRFKSLVQALLNAQLNLGKGATIFVHC